MLFSLFLQLSLQVELYIYSSICFISSSFLGMSAENYILWTFGYPWRSAFCFNKWQAFWKVEDSWTAGLSLFSVNTILPASFSSVDKNWIPVWFFFFVSIFCFPLDTCKMFFFIFKEFYQNMPTCESHPIRPGWSSVSPLHLQAQVLMNFREMFFCCLLICCIFSFGNFDYAHVHSSGAISQLSNLPHRFPFLYHFVCFETFLALQLPD